MTTNTALKTIDESAQSRLAALLADLENSGDAKVRDIFPGLNTYLKEQGPGAVGLYKVTEVLPNSLESSLRPGEFADVYNVLDVENKGVRFAFYANNGGIKAKMRGVEKDALLIILYFGDQPSDTKGHNDWADFRIVELKNEKTALSILKQTRDSLKLKA